jgi:hypothetical protein
VALKVIQGARVIPEQQVQQQPESNLAWLGSNIGTGLTNIGRGVSGALGGLGYLASLPGRGAMSLADLLAGQQGIGAKDPFTGQPIHGLEFFTAGLPSVAGPMGLAEHYLPEALKRAPQTGAEKAIQTAIGELPMFLLGGINPQTLGRAAAGVGAGTAAQQAGFGPVGQAVTQALAQGGFGAATRPSLGNKAALAYETAAEGGPGMVTSKVSDAALKPIFSEIGRKYGAAIKPAQRTVLENLSKSLKNARSGIGKVSLGKLFDTRTALKEAYYDLKNAGFSALATKTRKAINNTILGEEAKIVNPRYWNAVSQGDKLKIAEHLRQPFADFIERSVDKLPRLPGDIQKLINVLSPVARVPEAFVGYLANPTFRKHALNLMFAIEEGGPKDIYKYLGQLANATSKSDQSNKYAEEKKPAKNLNKLRLVPGARVIG